MLKELPRKKESPQLISAYKGVVCGGCKYERKKTDLNPEWQCPCCESAYSKVNVSSEDKQRILAIKNAKYRDKNSDKKIAEMKKSKQISASVMGTVGVIAFLQGLGANCACNCINLYTKASSNPWILAIGGVILVGALVLGVSSFSR